MGISAAITMGISGISAALPPISASKTGSSSSASPYARQKWACAGEKDANDLVRFGRVVKQLTRSDK